MTASVEWARKNEDKVLKIINNMHNYAARFSTAQFAIEYTHLLLVKYGALLDFNVTLRQQTSHGPVLALPGDGGH